LNGSEGVHYFEARFAPQLLASRAEDGDLILVLKAVTAGLQRAKDEFNSNPDVKAGRRPPYDFAIIVCAMRMFLASMSTYYKVG
jgi:adenosine deaminase